MGKIMGSWLDKWYARLLTSGSLIGLVASLWQAAERVHMLKNPDAVLNCNINPVVDCSSVLNDKLSALFGFPNAFLGMVMFTILFVSGLLLLAGGKFNGWYRHLVAAVSFILLCFSAWFFGVSLYIIGKVCIFCLFIWAMAVPIFWYGLLYWLSSFTKPSKWQQSLMAFGNKYKIEPIITIYILMAILYMFRFRDYYF